MGKWDLSVLYDSINTKNFTSDVESLRKQIAEAIALSEICEKKSERELVCEYISTSEKISELLSKLTIYVNLRYSANTKDSEAASALGMLMNMASDVAGADAKLHKHISQIENLEKIIDENGLSEYRYFLNNIKKNSRHLLSEREETLFAKMSISGANAFSDMHSALTSSLEVEMDGKTLTLSSVRNLAYSSDAKTRKAAYEAELKAYKKIEDAIAFALNSIKLQVISECEMRGYTSPLDKALSDSRMSRATLDALLLAMEEYMPKFREYLRAKARALGHEGGLPFYDLFAPMGKCDTVYTVESAKDYLLAVFKEFDTELHDMVKTAFENSWIDFYPRESKVGGAFDCGVPSIKQSRVLTNFDGTFSDVVTLAHELGHSFHDRQVFAHSILTQDYSMPVAETASTFNEVLVMSTAIKNAKSKEEKLALIESELMDACQIICDIYSRFTFEKSVFDNRSTEFMGASRLCELMISAQKKAYGDGLCEEAMHPYMWLCKGHYYSGGLSYYNFPYAFGGLFARGLYAKYQNEGAAFVENYKKLLYTTSVADVEDTAKIAGIDLTSPDFWRAGLKTIADEIDEFCELCKN
jgi:pepF/M3 family oligoendopeptidase